MVTIKSRNGAIATVLGLAVAAASLLAYCLYSRSDQGLNWKVVLRVAYLAFLAGSILTLIGLRAARSILHLAGYCFLLAAKRRSGEEAKQMFEKSRKFMRKAMPITPASKHPLYPWAKYVLEAAQKKTGEEADWLFEQLCKEFEMLASAEPHDIRTWQGWGNALSQQARKKDDSQAFSLLEQACEKYEQATRIKTNSYSMRCLTGTLLELATMTSGAERDRLAAQACQECEHWARIYPCEPDALITWGLALFLQTREKTQDEAGQLFTQAREQFRHASRVDPRNYKVYYYWGYLLHCQLDKADADKADLLLSEAIERYEQALRIKPKDAHLLCYCARALADLARRKDGDEAAQLLAQAFEKNQKAAEIMQQDPYVFADWGYTLMEQADRHTGPEREELLEQAKEKLLQAEQIKRGSGAYNLACVFALKHDEDQCRKWLKLGEDCKTLFPKEHALADEDLKDMREKDWFKAICWGQHPYKRY